MRVDELDEYQGLEAQMVRDWMVGRGCYRQDGYWRHPRDKYRYTDGEYGGLLWEDTLFKLSVDFELASVQALLREINPRMRKGVPSQEAINAHADRHWVAKSSQRGGVTRIIEIAMGSVVMVQTLSETQRIGLDSLPEGWHYWPCDDHGNKVRWPTDATGEML